MFRNALKTFGIIGNIEAVSYLLLVCIAMPLKYAADMPQMVSWVGMIHGVLFVAYVAAIVVVLILRKLTVLQGIIALVASLLPFGPFIFDRKVLKKAEARNGDTTPVKAT
jgi:integral membrane protein